MEKILTTDKDDLIRNVFVDKDGRIIVNTERGVYVESSKK